MFLKWFSRFTDPLEAQMYDFLHRAPRLQAALAHQQAEAYLQQDAARLTILLEWKFKGYKHLKKSYRRQCYANLALLTADFNRFAQGKPAKTATEYLEIIRQYLSPQRFTYQASSSFDKLCRNPAQEKPTGDCNQLVTLYVYLFAQKFRVSDLQLKFLPEHVCLHHKGQDYETTNGQRVHYKKFTHLGPLSELVSVNLLDIADRAAQHALPATNRLLCAQLALVFTGDKTVANHNIQAAYQESFNQALKQQQWKIARQHARAINSPKMVQLAQEAEAFAALEQKQYRQARRIFAKAQSSRGAQAVDQTELADLLKSLHPHKTLAALRPHQATLKRVRTLAQKTGQPKVRQWAENTLKQL